MKDLLDFFLKVSTLETLKRTGWVWRGIKNPETVAEHSFRVAFFAWILGADTGLQMKKMLKMAILHDICEVYSGDLTPFHGILSGDPSERKKTLKRWIRLPQRKKAFLVKNRVVIEKKALVRLIKNLSTRTQMQILALWAEFEHGLSPEGRFVKQIDKIEAMLQAIEYFGTGPDTPVTGWWEEIEELVDHPVLKEFVQAIHYHLYKNEKTQQDNNLEFLSQIGKLKRQPRPIWLLRKVKNPNSEADHAFMLTLMAWIFAKENRQRLGMEKILKMALCSRLGFIDQKKTLTRYDNVLKLAKTEEEKRAILQKWIRHPIDDKKRLFLSAFDGERKSIGKLTSKLDARLKSEIPYLWREYKTNQTPEARFLNQVYVLEVLLRALQYWAKDKKFAIEPWWEMAFEFSDSDINLEFMAALKQKFYKKKRGLFA